MNHKHRCNKCGRVWEHNDECAGDRKAHTCQCGSVQFWKYEGTEPPERFQSCAGHSDPVDIIDPAERAALRAALIAKFKAIFRGD